MSNESNFPPHQLSRYDAHITHVDTGMIIDGEWFVTEAQAWDWFNNYDFPVEGEYRLTIAPAPILPNDYDRTY